MEPRGCLVGHRKWKEAKQQPGTAGPGNILGCCLIYIHFLWGKLSTRTVNPQYWLQIQNLETQFEAGLLGEGIEQSLDKHQDLGHYCH